MEHHALNQYIENAYVKDKNNYVPTPITDEMKIEGIINTLKDNGKKYLEYPVPEYPTQWKD